MSAGVSAVYLPAIIFIICFIGYIYLMIYTSKVDTTEILFNVSVFFLFLGSVYHYPKEKKESRGYYLITYWVVALIFFMNIVREIVWIMFW
ncbi:MAG: hypothetical protein QXQ40_00860 [Candidatus Aenigmatarchaeota archaeon]